MTATHECNGPCPVPPHPNLLEHYLAQQLHVQDAHTNGATHYHPPTRRFGLNDGTIFSKARFPNLSGAELMRAASERVAGPLRGTIKVAVVLVDFNDQPMADGVTQRFKDLFFSQGVIPTKSVTEYYTDVSGAKIALTGDVVGPFRMPHNMTDYANGDFGMGSVAPNIQTFGADALAASRGHINLSGYDNDGNGMADASIVVHAGTSGEVTNDRSHIWSVKWQLPTETPVDGVAVSMFLTVPEDALLGVCAHELGHLLFQWPDLYALNHATGAYTADGIGNWCLMADGPWGGLGQRGDRDDLVDVKESHEVHRLWTNGATGPEYFLVENREQVGFDHSIPAPGLLVWHIDENELDNSDPGKPYKVALMQADGLNQLATVGARGDPGDPFPGSRGNTSFTSESNPSSLSYAGQDTKVSITSISSPAQIMTMSLTVN